MNRKLLAIVLALAVVLLATPMLGTVMAGKGQDRLSFKLLFQGLPVGGDVWESDGNTIHRDTVFVLLGDYYVQIGDGGAVEDITKEYLEYEGLMNYVTHTTPEEFYTVNVKEVISIYSSTMHNENTLRGTLEITAIGDNRGGHGGNFAGHGTGEFEGVKILGNSNPLEIVGGNPDPPFIYVQLTRLGTVMGWP